MRSEFVTTLATLPTRFCISRINSPTEVQGLLLSGELSAGDGIAVAITGRQSTVKSINGEELMQRAMAPLEITVTFSDDLQLNPGDIISHADDRPEVADQFEATIHWLGENEMLPGRTYTLVAAFSAVQASISKLKYRVSRVGTEQIAATTLSRGESGNCNLTLTAAIAFDPVSINPVTAKFELLEKETGATIARGEIRHGLRRANNLHWQALDVDKAKRAAIKNQTPRVLWLTGLSASGKSTIANLLEQKLIEQARHPYLLDGDNVRHGLNRDLGFTAADRVENIRRVAETAKLMLDAGLIVITSFISPFKAERAMARALFNKGEFLEVFIDASLAVCEARDPKGLYKKARRGELKNFTGFDSPYELPDNPDLHLDTESMSAEQCANTILEHLEKLTGSPQH